MNLNVSPGMRGDEWKGQNSQNKADDDSGNGSLLTQMLMLSGC